MQQIPHALLMTYDALYVTMQHASKAIYRILKHMFKMIFFINKSFHFQIT